MNTGELYDVVSYSVHALRTLWDQKNDRAAECGNNRRTQQLSEAPPTHLPALPPPARAAPALPPKSKSRKLTGAVSIDTVSLSQVTQNDTS